MNARKLKDKGYDAFLKKKYDKALQYFSEAAKLDSKDLNIQQKIAETLLRLGKKSEALKVYKKLASVFAQKGFLMKAIGVYKLILDIEPEAEDVKELLTKLYAERGVGEETKIEVSPSTLIDKIKRRKEEVEEKISEEKEKVEEEMKIEEEMPMEEETSGGVVPEEELEVEIEEEGEDNIELSEDITQWINNLETEEEEEDLDGLAEKLPSFPIFSQCSKECFSDIIDGIALIDYAPDDIIIEEGDSGKSFYIIVEGEVKVTKKTDEGEIELARLGEGSFFGEFAFLTGAKRSASVIAATPTRVLEFSEDMLEQLLRKHPDIASILVEFYKKRILDTMLAISPFFKGFDPSDRKKVLEMFEFYEIPENTIVIREDSEGDGLYIIMFGKVKVTKRDEKEVIHQVAVLKEGDFFGEISLLTHGPTTASVTTLERTGVFKLPAHKFQEMIMIFPQILEITYQYKEKREEELRKLFADPESITRMGIV